MNGTVVALLSFLLSFGARAGVVPDSTSGAQEIYDPFGPENAPDHTGQGSGGVLTASPYESIVQTYFTRVNADLYGLQYMYDSPLQVSMGSGWSAYQTHAFGLQVKVRSTGFRQMKYDPVRMEEVPYYLTCFEASFDRSFEEKSFRAFRIRVHTLSETKGLGMPGVGVVYSTGNLLIGGDRSMNRKLEVELTWVQIAGGYIMPLSPMKGDFNVALGGALELLGGKYQSFYSDRTEFVGAKIGSAGWVAGVGWNANALVNLALYVGTEWSFSTGALVLETDKAVAADISRTSVYLGLQATGTWANLTGGIQKEWESVDFQGTEGSARALRYYLGLNVYFRR